MSRSDLIVMAPAFSSSMKAITSDETAQHVSASAPQPSQGIGPGTKETQPAGVAKTIETIAVVLAKEELVSTKSHIPEDDAIGDSPESATVSSVNEKAIIGRNDRAHHLALSSVPGTLSLQSPKMSKANTRRVVVKTSMAAAVKSRSSSKCEGRCGANGFCDPWNEHGCSGIYCGRRFDKE